MRIACLLVLSAISGYAQDLEGMLSRKQSEIERKEASRSSAVQTASPSPSPQMMELPRNSLPQTSETKRAEPKMSENRQAGFRRNWKTVPSTVSAKHAVGTFIHGKFTVQKISQAKHDSFNLLISDAVGTRFLLFEQPKSVAEAFPEGGLIYAKDWCPLLIDSRGPSGVHYVRAIARTLDNRP